MSELNGKGSGTSPTAATANWDLGWQPPGNLIIADGFGNVAGMNLNIQQVKVEISATQILNLSTVPVLIVPGNGGIIVPYVGVVCYHPGTIPYTLGANDYVSFVYPVQENNNGYMAWFYAQPGMDTLVEQQFIITAGAYFPVAAGNLVGQPILLMNNYSANMTLGNGTLTISLYYFTIPAPNALP